MRCKNKNIRNVGVCVCGNVNFTDIHVCIFEWMATAQGYDYEVAVLKLSACYICLWKRNYYVILVFRNVQKVSSTRTASKTSTPSFFHTAVSLQSYFCEDVAIYLCISSMFLIFRCLITILTLFKPLFYTYITRKFCSKHVRGSSWQKITQAKHTL